MSSQPSLRERKKRRTHLDLVATALDLFDRRGFEATTIDDIAERAGCSRRTFFRYFASKEDVAFGDALERLAGFRNRLDSAPLEGREPFEIVRDALRDEALAFYGEPVDRASMELWFREPALARRWIEISQSWEDATAAYLASHRGTDPESDTTAQVVATALCGVVKATLRARVDSADEAAAALDDGFAMVTEGLAAHVSA